MSVNPPRKVSFDDLDYDYAELADTYQGHPFTGVAFEDVPGKCYAEVEFQDGMRMGWSREWSTSGVLMNESKYHGNALHGVSSVFYEDGRPRSRKHYEYGILVREEGIDPQGRVVNEWEIGDRDPLYGLLIKCRAFGWPDTTPPGTSAAR